MLARRLAVFPGGATLAAAEYVCADELLPRAAVLPALSGLVDKSILGVAEGQDGLSPRYRMLETVRAYGLERLADAGEEAAVRERVRRVLPGPGRDRGSGGSARPGRAAGCVS